MPSIYAALRISAAEDLSPSASHSSPSLQVSTLSDATVIAEEADDGAAEVQQQKSKQY